MAKTFHRKPAKDSEDLIEISKRKRVSQEVDSRLRDFAYLELEEFEDLEDDAYDITNFEKFARRR